MGHERIRQLLENTFPTAGAPDRNAAPAHREDPHLRIHCFTTFVRDMDRSLGFYLNQLGFRLLSDSCEVADRCATVAPPDGTAILALVAPQPGSAECALIGQGRFVVFITDDVTAKYREWTLRGVRFPHPPQAETWGGIVTGFEDVDGNRYTLVGFDPANREIEAQRRAAQEMETARQVQAKLFPQVQPALTTLEYAGVCVQARQVGGDYFDFLDLGRGRLGLVVGDISGKGVAAALLMANLQAHVRNLCTTYSSRPFAPFALEQPQRFLRTVNRLFHENTTDSAYATLIFAEYDDKARRLRYANCGHLAGLLLRGDNTLEVLPSTSTVLGLFKEWDCVIGERHLAPGDTLALYTDGITESFNEAGEPFGEERLTEALRLHRDLPPQALLRSVVGEAQRFGAQEQHDDITLIVAKCR